MTEKNHKADLLAALSLQEEMGATALLDNTPRKRTAPTGKIGGKVEGKAQSRAQDRAGGKETGKPQGKIGDKATGKPQDAAGVDAMGAEDMGAGSTAEKSTPPRRAKKPVFSAEIAEAQKLAAQADSLEALWQTIAAFEGCNLRAGANNTVIWRGNATARLAIVGEAPGADEDAQGKPFVGRAGKLLDGLLHWAGFDESQVFITNVVFWRPPKNRAPEPAEVSVCLPFVWKQLALLKPEIVLLLGNTPMKALLPRLGTSGITRARGQWTNFASEDTGDFAKEPKTTQAALQMPVYGSFHPAYLLRSPQQTRFAWADLLAVAEKYETLTGEKLQTRP